MLNQKFYWGTIRKSIVAFGNMFNDIHIDRRNSAGEVIQTIRVPLAYAPRQQFLARIQQQPNADTSTFEVVLPRMSFEMNSIDYDPSRKIAPTQVNRIQNTTTNSVTMQYAPAPYNINVSLYLYSRNQDDGLQVVEQILPYFNPDYNLSLKAVPSLNIVNDLPIILESINYEDQYEGDLTSRRMIIWTFTFVMKLNFYGPTDRQSIIRRTITTSFNDKSLSQTLQVHTAEVPATAKPGDQIDISETFEDF
jgi:hypothetical protein